MLQCLPGSVISSRLRELIKIFHMHVSAVQISSVVSAWHGHLWQCFELHERSLGFIMTL